ncbi:MAG: BREX-1 system adenine-specific DNA-methyltransferase PglX [Erysipelotrichia bacterium]|nr:BREX-1 system adenine-specific DNA-methyltransferase PglX [Erysipelotrichia bacterium]
MKLTDHVNFIRTLIEKAFDKQFAGLGIGVAKELKLDEISKDLHVKRAKLDLIIQNHIGEMGSYKDAREKVLDELTFTLFNRIAAIKVMEAHELFPPIITKDAIHGDRSFGHKAWLEENPSMRAHELEGLREYIKHAFNTLGEEFPLYHKNHPYALLPHVIELGEIITAFNALEKDTQVETHIWQSDDVLGWLYESYNTSKKQAFKDSGDKTEYDKVSLQSQVYTPKWVVEFLVNNALGKLYLEMYPSSTIKDRYKIANAPKERTRELKPITEIKLIDPACGSGNFLLYAFDLFYELYVDQMDNYGLDVEKKEIPKLIIENNLHGIDLDDRAIQIAQLGLYIKAKKRRRTIQNLSFSVVSSDFFLPPYSEVKHIFEGSKLEIAQQKLVEEIWADLQQAYKFGSLVKIGEKLRMKIDAIDTKSKDLFSSHIVEEHKAFEKSFFNHLKIAVAQYAQDENHSFLSTKTADAMKFLEIITMQYDIATANPPYTDSSDFGADLKEFIDKEYKVPYKFNTNLYATFIKRCHELTNKNGKMALVHPPTFMYIKTFEDVRAFMLDKTHIDFFVEWGYLGMFHPSARVDSAMYVLEKNMQTKDSSFIKLNEIYEGKRYDVFVEAYSDYCESKENKHNYTLPQEKLKIIKSYPFIYWISDEFREKFKVKNFEYYLKLATGLMTGDNLRFLRFHWELQSNNISKDYVLDKRNWVPYQKGGDYNKWFGNNWLLVNFTNNGKLLATTDNKAFYFSEGITYSATSSKGVSFRKLPQNQIFDKKGSCIFNNLNKQKVNLDYTLAVLNSKISFYILECLNSTVETQIGDVKRIPFVIPLKPQEELISNLAKINIEIKKHLCSFSITETNFTQNPLYISAHANLKERLLEYLNYENYLLAEVLLNEAIINEEIFKVYELSESDKAMVLEKEGKSVGDLHVELEAKEAYLSYVVENFDLSLSQTYINALHVKAFDADKKAEIIKAFESLYQANNDLEEFCIKHEVNPINVWHWFQESKNLPKQRMNTIALEFLVDMIREILAEDEDGIVPLVPNAGEQILLQRVHEKFYQKGFSDAQTSSFDVLLGKELGSYLLNNFFKELSDHLNLFMYLPKTPFIWHLSSGEYRGFECLISIYKWSRDNLLRIKSVYIENRERALQNRQLDLSNDNSASAQNEKDLIFKQLREIETYKAKIDDLLAEGYNPELDSGVGKNIAPLQKRKMISYEVLNAGQLKKYLAAEW